MWCESFGRSEGGVEEEEEGEGECVGWSMRGVEEEGVWPAECNNDNAFQTTGCFSEEISSVSSPT